MKTVIEVFKFIQSFPWSVMGEFTSYFDTLEPVYRGFFVERLFEILSLYKCIASLDSYILQNGNFNQGNLCDASIYSIMHNPDGKEANIQQGGDSADLVYKHETNDHYLALSSKFLANEQIGKLDLEKMSYNAPDEKTKFALLVPSASRTRDIIKRAHHTSDKLVNGLNKCLLLDINDIWMGYLQFRNLGPADIDSISSKRRMNLRINQDYATIQILSLKEEGYPNSLLCHEPRSGKTYIVAACIDRDSRKNGHGVYLVLTTAPKETLAAYLHLFRTHREFDDCMIIDLRNEDTPEVLSPKTIILGSKQLLQMRLNEKVDSVIANAHPSIVFLDESHKGGCTSLANRVLDTYAKSAFRVMISSTFSKPALEYDIPKERCCMWSQRSNLAAQAGSYDLLMEIHNNDPVLRRLLDQIPVQVLRDQYRDVPVMITFTHSIRPNVLDEIKQDLKRSSSQIAGYSDDAAFLLHPNGSFQNEPAALNVLTLIFGRNEGRVPDKSSFMHRISKHAQKNGSRTIESMALIDPLTAIMFLTLFNVSGLARAVIDLLNKHNMCDDCEFVSINSKETPDPLAAIDAGKQRVLNSRGKKKWVLVLAGLQCSLAATIQTCDIVILANNSMLFDMIFQMMTRSMSRADGKKYGYVIDLNIRRQITLTVQIAKQSFPQGKSLKHGFMKLVEERLVSINPDEFEIANGTHVEKMEALSTNLYNMYESIRATLIPHMYQKLLDVNVILDASDISKLSAFRKLQTRKGESVTFMEKIVTCDLPEGKEIMRVDNEDATSSIEVEKDGCKKEVVSFPQILFYLTPMIILLNYHNEKEDLYSMYLDLKTDDIRTRFTILMNVVRELWSHSLNENDLDGFFYIYNRMNDQEIADLVRSIKTILQQNKNHPEILSAEIDRYLIPHFTEIKRLAEIPTLHPERRTMLDKFPISFWKNPNTKILEPCCGKGHFVLDIITRFMCHLGPIIIDEEARYRHIVENCVYFIDINSLNIYITRLLIDPDNKYNLNMHTGNSLEELPWNLNIFNGCVMNSPYTTSQEKNSRESTPLCGIFVNRFAYEIPFCVWIMPQRWFVTGKGLDDFRSEFKQRTDIVSINSYMDSKAVFGNHVDIKGGVAIFVRDASYTGECNFDGTMVNLSVSDIVLSPRDYHMYVAGKDACSKHGSIDQLFMGRYYGIETNEPRLLAGPTNSSIPCYVSLKQSKTRKMYIENDESIAQKDRFWKVFTPAAFEKAHSGFGPLNIGKPNELHSASYVSFRVKHYAEALSLQSYLRTKYANAMLSIRKVSQTISKDTLKWIPMVPLDRIWDDDLVKNYLDVV